LAIEYKIGGMDLTEQTILTNFYNGLTSKGNLNWNILNNLCGQSGVSCDSSNQEESLNCIFSFSFSFSIKNNEQNFEMNQKKKKKKKKKKK